MVTLCNIDSSRSTEELKKRVRLYYNLSEGPPEPGEIFSKPTDNLLIKIQSSTSMIAYLMMIEIDEKWINETEQGIKLPFTYYNNFGKEFKTECNKETEDDDKKIFY